MQDKYLDRFLSLCTVLEDGNIPPRIGEANMESELKTRYDDLCWVSAVSVAVGWWLYFDSYIALAFTYNETSIHHFRR